MSESRCNADLPIIIAINSQRLQYRDFLDPRFQSEVRHPALNPVRV